MSLYLHSVLGDPVVTQYVSVLAFMWPNCHKTCLWCGFRWPNCHQNWLCIHFYVTQLSHELPLYQPICDPIVTRIVFVSSFRWPNCHQKCVCVCCCFLDVFLADQQIRDQHKLALCFTPIITSMYALYTHFGILSNLGDLALFVLMHFTMREESCLLKYTYLHLFLTNYC